MSNGASYKLAGLMDCCTLTIYKYNGDEGPGLTIGCMQCSNRMQLGVDGVWVAVPRVPKVMHTVTPTDPVMQTQPPTPDLAAVLVHEEDPDSGKHRNVRPKPGPEQVPSPARITESDDPEEFAHLLPHNPSRTGMAMDVLDVANVIEIDGSRGIGHPPHRDSTVGKFDAFRYTPDAADTGDVGITL